MNAVLDFIQLATPTGEAMKHAILDAAPLFKAWAELDEELQSESLDLFVQLADEELSLDEAMATINLLEEMLCPKNEC